MSIHAYVTSCKPDPECVHEYVCLMATVLENWDRFTCHNVTVSKGLMSKTL